MSIKDRTIAVCHQIESILYLFSNIIIFSTFTVNLLLNASIQLDVHNDELIYIYVHMYNLKETLDCAAVHINISQVQYL